MNNFVDLSRDTWIVEFLQQADRCFKFDRSCINRAVKLRSWLVHVQWSKTQPILSRIWCISWSTVRRLPCKGSTIVSLQNIVANISKCIDKDLNDHDRDKSTHNLPRSFSCIFDDSVGSFTLLKKLNNRSKQLLASFPKNLPVLSVFPFIAYRSPIAHDSEARAVLPFLLFLFSILFCFTWTNNIEI